jgi:hypothetical protein
MIFAPLLLQGASESGDIFVSPCYIFCGIAGRWKSYDGHKHIELLVAIAFDKLAYVAIRKSYLQIGLSLRVIDKL